MAFKDYSLTPDDNTTLGDGTYIGPNMLRNKVRPALQQIAADGRDLYDEMQNLVDVATGPAGPAGNVAITLAALKASPITNRTMIAAFSGGSPFNWETANAPYTADDVNIVQSDSTALATGAWVRQGTDFLLYAPNGVTAEDAIAATTDEAIQGREYLSEFTRRLVVNTGQTVILGGDSTVTQVSPNTLAPINLLETELRNRGLKTGNFILSGHSGDPSSLWLSTYLAADLALNPTLYILRWGLNDTVVTDTDEVNANRTINNIAAGLAIIRTTKTPADLQVLICTPNTAYDPAHGRTPGYFHRVSVGLRAVARQYDAGFLDLIRYAQDATNGGWIKKDFTSPDGYVHPLDQMNVLQYALIAEAVWPRGMTSMSSFATQNYAYPDGLKAASATPSSYPAGHTIRPCLTSDGWPYQGWVSTVPDVTGYAEQICYSAEGTTPKGRKVAWRISTANDNTWGPWNYRVTNSAEDTDFADFTPATGWSAFSSSHPRYRSRADMIQLAGRFQYASGGFTDGTLIGTLPSGLRSSVAQQVGVRYTVSGAVTGSGALDIGTDGTIKTKGMASMVATDVILLDGISISR